MKKSKKMQKVVDFKLEEWYINWAAAKRGLFLKHLFKKSRKKTKKSVDFKKAKCYIKWAIEKSGCRSNQTNKKKQKKIKKLLTLLIGFDILVTQLVNRNLKKMIFENWAKRQFWVARKTN